MLFAEYGKELLVHLHRIGQLDKPNLILLDSHYSHVFNYAYMSMMYQRDVKVMALRTNTSHLNQPLDKKPYYLLDTRVGRGGTGRGGG